MNTNRSRPALGANWRATKASRFKALAEFRREKRRLKKILRMQAAAAKRQAKAQARAAAISMKAASKHPASTPLPSSYMIGQTQVIFSATKHNGVSKFRSKHP